MQLKVPSADLPNTPFLPTPHTEPRPRAISKIYLNFQRKKLCTHVPDVRLIYKALKVNQDSCHICPQDCSKIILAMNFTYWLGESVSIDKLVNLTHPCSCWFTVLTSLNIKFPRFRLSPVFYVPLSPFHPFSPLKYRAPFI